MDGQHQEADARTAQSSSFPAPKGSELLARVKRRLAELRAERHADPVSNPVERLGFEISREIDEGKLSLEELGNLAHALVMHGYEERIARLRAYIEPFAKGGEERIRATVRSLMKRDGELIPFTDFQERVSEQPYGIVFTAHPTFAVPDKLMEGIAQLATMTDHVGRPLSEATRAELIAQAITSDHTHAKRPTLAYELHEASKVIARCRAAIDQAHRIFLEEAHANYPGEWQSLLPCLVTIASWTGYDLDGRIDLSWADILKARTEFGLGHGAPLCRAPLCAFELRALFGLNRDRRARCRSTRLGR